MGIVTVILVLAAGLCFLLAHLVANRGHMHLLAGYDPERVADPRGLAGLAGRTLVAVGTGTLGLLVTLIVVPRAATAVGIAYILFIVASAVYLTRSGKRFAR